LLIRLYMFIEKKGRGGGGGGGGKICQEKKKKKKKKPYGILGGRNEGKEQFGRFRHEVEDIVYLDVEKA